MWKVETSSDLHSACIFYLATQQLQSKCYISRNKAIFVNENAYDSILWNYFLSLIVHVWIVKEKNK